MGPLHLGEFTRAASLSKSCAWFFRVKRFWWSKHFLTASIRPLIRCKIAGAAMQQADLGKAQLQTLGRGKFLLWKAVGLDFAMTQGKYEGSPKFGGALGLSLDF